MAAHRARDSCSRGTGAISLRPWMWTVILTVALLPQHVVPREQTSKQQNSQFLWKASKDDREEIVIDQELGSDDGSIAQVGQETADAGGVATGRALQDAQEKAELDTLMEEVQKADVDISPSVEAELSRIQERKAELADALAKTEVPLESQPEEVSTEDTDASQVEGDVDLDIADAMRSRQKHFQFQYATYENRNCGNNHGGKNIDYRSKSNVAYSLPECKERCSATPNCDCIAFQERTGVCMMRSKCVISECAKSATWNVYLKIKMGYISEHKRKISYVLEADDSEDVQNGTNVSNVSNESEYNITNITNVTNISQFELVLQPSTITITTTKSSIEVSTATTTTTAITPTTPLPTQEPTALPSPSQQPTERTVPVVNITDEQTVLLVTQEQANITTSNEPYAAGLTEFQPGSNLVNVSNETILPEMALQTQRVDFSNASNVTLVLITAIRFSMQISPADFSISDVFQLLDALEEVTGVPVADMELVAMYYYIRWVIFTSVEVEESLMHGALCIAFGLPKSDVTVEVEEVSAVSQPSNQLDSGASASAVGRRLHFHGSQVTITIRTSDQSKATQILGEADDVTLIQNALLQLNISAALTLTEAASSTVELEVNLVDRNGDPHIDSPAAVAQLEKKITALFGANVTILSVHHTSHQDYEPVFTLPPTPVPAPSDRLQLTGALLFNVTNADSFAEDPGVINVTMVALQAVFNLDAADVLLVTIRVLNLPSEFLDAASGYRGTWSPNDAESPPRRLSSADDQNVALVELIYIIEVPEPYGLNLIAQPPPSAAVFKMALQASLAAAAGLLQAEYAVLHIRFVVPLTRLAEHTTLAAILQETNATEANITINETLPVCGDGMRTGAEVEWGRCDDGNLFLLDGCDANCYVEYGWYCNNSDPCFTICGDGLIGYPRENCDEGNVEPYDGCGTQCRIEAGRCSLLNLNRFCFGSWMPRRIIDPHDFCEGYKCRLHECCELPSRITMMHDVLRAEGWTCAVRGSELAVQRNGEELCEPICGDGLEEGAERQQGRCDDGNLRHGDGCDAGCRVEPGWYCYEEGRPCESICGDGEVAEPVEECDDGNNYSFDGCSSGCQLENGRCANQASALCGMEGYTPRADVPFHHFCNATTCTVAECCLPTFDTCRERTADGVARATCDVVGNGFTRLTNWMWSNPPICESYTCPGGWSKKENVDSAVCVGVDEAQREQCALSSCCETTGTTCTCARERCCAPPLRPPPFIAAGDDGDAEGIQTASKYGGIGLRLDLVAPVRVTVGGLPRWYYYLSYGAVRLSDLANAFVGSTAFVDKVRDVALGAKVWGSSDSKYGRYAAVNDGDTSTHWHSGDVEVHVLYMDLGMPCHVEYMQLITSGVSIHYGFKQLRIYISMDMRSWTTVRADFISECSPLRISRHDGWEKAARYIKIEMYGLCTDRHVAQYALASWEIYGYEADVAKSISDAILIEAGSQREAIVAAGDAAAQAAISAEKSTMDVAQAAIDAVLHAGGSEEDAVMAATRAVSQAGGSQQQVIKAGGLAAATTAITQGGSAAEVAQAAALSVLRSGGSKAHAIKASGDAAIQAAIQAPNHITGSMTVLGVDFAALDSDPSLKNSFVTACQNTVASAVGISAANVQIDLSSGSVNVDYMIDVPPSNSAAFNEALADAVDGPLATDLVGALNSVPGINAVTSGVMSVTSLSKPGVNEADVVRIAAEAVLQAGGSQADLIQAAGDAVALAAITSGKSDAYVVNAVKYEVLRAGGSKGDVIKAARDAAVQASLNTEMTAIEIAIAIIRAVLQVGGSEEDAVQAATDAASQAGSFSDPTFSPGSFQDQLIKAASNAATTAAITEAEVAKTVEIPVLQKYTVGALNTTDCPIGFFMISSRQECETAASRLVLMWAWHVTDPGFPQGCYLAASYVYYNHAFAGASNGVAQPVCHTSTPEPTQVPTSDPTQEPTSEPTMEPTQTPTPLPTPEPTIEPTPLPTIDPTQSPTVTPTPEPTIEPTPLPTHAPTLAPTPEPTPEPTAQPTQEPPSICELSILKGLEFYAYEHSSVHPDAYRCYHVVVGFEIWQDASSSAGSCNTISFDREYKLGVYNSTANSSDEFYDAGTYSSDCATATGNREAYLRVIQDVSATANTAEVYESPACSFYVTITTPSCAWPTPAPTLAPTLSPTPEPTVLPTQAPTGSPTVSPSESPTEAPTEAPTVSPSAMPTEAPTESPTVSPSESPTEAPTESPTVAPSAMPTEENWTMLPTTEPTHLPTHLPTTSPTHSPTMSPTEEPTQLPTMSPTEPTPAPTPAPTPSPSFTPTFDPTRVQATDAYNASNASSSTNVATNGTDSTNFTSAPSRRLTDSWVSGFPLLPRHQAANCTSYVGPLVASAGMPWFSVALQGYMLRLPTREELQELFTQPGSVPNVPDVLDAEGAWEVWSATPCKQEHALESLEGCCWYAVRGRPDFVGAAGDPRRGAAERSSTYPAHEDHSKHIILEVSEAFTVVHGSDRLERRMLVTGAPCCSSLSSDRAALRTLAAVPSEVRGATLFALADADLGTALPGGDGVFTVIAQVPSTVFLVAAHDMEKRFLGPHSSLGTRRGHAKPGFQEFGWRFDELVSGFDEHGWERVLAPAFRLDPWGLPMAAWRRKAILPAGGRLEIPHRAGLYGAVALRHA